MTNNHLFTGSQIKWYRSETDFLILPLAELHCGQMSFPHLQFNRSSHVSVQEKTRVHVPWYHIGNDCLSSFENQDCLTSEFSSVDENRTF